MRSDLKITEIPDFLLRNIAISRDAQRQFINDLQLLLLWNHVNGDKPYNKKEARTLQKTLRQRYNAHKEKQRQKRLERRNKAQKEYLTLCQRIAESVLTVEVFGENVEKTGEIDWNTPIKDAVTDAEVGTPHTLFNGIDSSISLDWDMRPFDARKNLEEYLSSLNRRYDGFSYPFKFDRSELKKSPLARIRLEEKPFGKEPPAMFSFRLRLSYRPSTRETKKIVEKMLKSG